MTIAVIAASAEVATAWWSTGPAQAWIGTSARLNTLTFSDLIHRRDSADTIRESQAVVLLTDAASPTRDVLSAAWRLDELDAQGVILADATSENLSKRLGHAIGAMPVLDTATDPRQIAGFLGGIATQARTLRVLQRQVEAIHTAERHADTWLVKMDEELHLAARLQQEIMPREFPLIDNFSFAAVFEPLWHVSGDIYRVSRLDEDHIGVFLADAMGHGVAAAMYTMLMACGLVGKEVVGGDYRLVPPHEALRRLNLDLIRQQQQQDPGAAVRFASAIYLVINTKTLVVRGSIAGHAGPLRLRNGEWSEIDTAGPVLGVFEDAVFEPCEFTLEPDETLVLYSDGVEQVFLDEAIARDARGMDVAKPPLGERLPRHREMLAAALCSRPGLSLEQNMLRFTEGLQGHAGSLHRSDDLTVLALRTH